MFKAHILTLSLVGAVILAVGIWDGVVLLTQSVYV